LTGSGAGEKAEGGDIETAKIRDGEAEKDVEDLRNPRED
jgi:hypothetical protein